MRLYLRKFLFVSVFLCLSLSLLSGCGENESGETKNTAFTSIYDIPGITEDDIRAVDTLRNKYDSFTYGAFASTESFYNENGEFSGFTALFCEWLTELFGIEFIPSIHEWEELYPYMTVDFTGDLTATPKRTAELGIIFSDTIASRSTKYFRVANNRAISDISMTRPLKLAFFEGSTTAKAAIEKLEEASILYEPFYLNDYDSTYKMLKSGEVDAFVHESIAEAAFIEMGDIVVEDFFPFIFEPVSLSTQNPELKPIIDIIQKALAGNANHHLADLYELGMMDYTQYKFIKRLDEREVAYLHDNTAVAYLAEFDNYPLSFYNANENEWQGIAFDVLKEITALTGLTFEPIHEPGISFSELMLMLENGEGSMLSELIRNSSRETRFLWPNNSTLLDNYVAITKTQMPSISPHRIMQYSVGIQEGTAYADLFHHWFPDHPHVTVYDGTDPAFKGLENGDVDILFYSMNNLLTATNYHEKPGFKANIVFDYVFASSFGFNLNEEILCSIIDKAMGVIDIQTISGEWGRRTFDYRSKIVESQRPWLIGAIILFVIVITLTFVLYLRTQNAGKRLDMLVQQRTAELDVSRQDLISALKEAKEANEAKSAFLATMSHEIRTPMNAILGIAQIQMQHGGLPDAYMDALERIYNSGRSLLGIINDILDMSKIETGKLELVLEEYDVPSLINDAVALNIVRIGSKAIEFELDIDENMPSRLYGDELRLKQVLNNLLSNAIKYTEQGMVKLAVSHAREDDEVSLNFVIEDTGQGMTLEDRDLLFSEYLRFNTNINRSNEGTGLGLSITKRLVNMMDGTIWAETEYGTGSVFMVTVKQTAVECDAIGAELAKQLCNFTFRGRKQFAAQNVTHEYMPYGRVLVVDDVDTNLYVAKGLMIPYALNIETVESGFAAIDKVNDGEVYDIIFMDHMMPKMDGIETVKRLRAAGYVAPIVALTANAVVGQAEMFMKNGFDSFISKPIDIVQLDSALNKYIRDRKPIEVVEEARRNKPDESAIIPTFEVDEELLAIFARDAKKAVAVIETFFANIESVSDDDYRLYAVNVHAMKSALANIGEREASGLAGLLEQAGKKHDKDALLTGTPSFIEKLQVIIEKIESNQAADEISLVDSEPAVLCEQLRHIVKACDDFDDLAIEAALAALNELEWSKETRELLDKIAEHVLHSDFEEAAEEASVYCAGVVV
ncbi:MAG: ATP-binding protein [Lachnospiraceae bacterium]|nr:ATP-binding protein [Lachnospiraceae bacterium]